MDLIKAQLSRLSQQLSGLTISQRMLAGTLIAIMVMTLFYWTRYAGEPEMEALLNQSFTAAEIDGITQYLGTKEIHYTVSGDKVMVPTDRKMEALAGLGFSHLLPQRTDAGFDDIVKQMNPFDSADKTDRMWTQAKQHTLENIIGRFPGVDLADVILDPHEQRGFSAGHDVKPSAGISITMRGDAKAVKQVANSAAELVAGAQAGVGLDSISVIVNGARVGIASGDQGSLADGDTIVDAIRAHEAMYKKKIEDEFGFIPGLFVSVRVDLNTKRIETTEKHVDPKNSGHLAVSEDERSTETVTPPADSEPGAIPNTSTSGELSVGSPVAQSNATSTDTQTKTTYQNEFGYKDTRTVQGPGDAPPASAAVRVPRSYFVGIYKTTNAKKEPDDAALSGLMKAELSTMRSEVENCLGIKSDDLVSVNWYADGDPTPATATVQASSPMSLMLGSHGKELGVSALAVVSLFMMVMMVRKSGPVPLVLPGAALETGTGQRLNVLASDITGEVGDGGGTMEGIEVGSEEAKTQQVINQVSTMVAEDPESAASLVKRWLSHA